MFISHFFNNDLTYVVAISRILRTWIPKSEN